MPLALLFLYAVPAAIILVLGRGLLWLLSFFGIESWGLSFAFALALGVLVSPTMVAGDGVGLLPWILAPGDLSWGIFMSPVTCMVAWLAMGQPSPQSLAKPAEGSVPARVALVLKFPDDDPAP